MAFQNFVKMSSRLESSYVETNVRTVAFVQNPLWESVPADPPVWTYYHKPIIMMVLGGLVLSIGVVLYLLGMYEVTSVPHAMGPGCLSFGFMFIVVALVWLPLIKDKVRRKGLKLRHRSSVVEQL